jgi:hypothetical protein
LTSDTLGTISAAKFLATISLPRTFPNCIIDLSGGFSLPRDNINADFRCWRGKQLRVGADLMSMTELLQHRNVGVVAIKNNTVYIFRNASSSEYTVVRVSHACMRRT